MATEFPILKDWQTKPPLGTELDLSGRLLSKLAFFSDGYRATGSTLYDRSLLANNATLSGTYTRTPDGSINYNGSSAKAAVSGSSSAGTFNFLHQNNQQATVSFWAKLDADNPDVFGAMMVTYDSIASGPGISINFDDRSSSGRNHHIFASIVDASSNSTTALSSAVAFPKDRKWHHICAVFDSTVASSATWLWLYVDAVLVASTTKTITPSTSNHAVNLTIGNRDGATLEFPGCIDNFEIYNGVSASLDDVQYLYANRYHAYQNFIHFITSTDAPAPTVLAPYYYQMLLAG